MNSADKIIVQCEYCEVKDDIKIMRYVEGRGFVCQDTGACDARDAANNPAETEW